MDTGTFGALVGTVMGIVGSVIGTAASLRRANSPAERWCIIKWAVALSILIGAFMAGFWITPASYRPWIWALYGAVLPLAIIAGNRDLARFHADHRSDAK